MVPAFGTNGGVHFSVKKNCAAIIAPRPTEKYPVLCVFAREGRIQKNKPARFVRCETHRCCDVSIAFAVDHAIVENRRGLPEDKIDMALDVAVFIVLAAVLCI